MSAPSEEAFLARLAPAARERLSVEPLRATLERHWEAARGAVALEADHFYAHLAEKVSAASDPVRAMADIDAPAIALALACSNGDPAALAIFEQRCLGGPLDRALMRLGAGEAEIDELKQRLRLKLLVAEPERRPRIADYSGRGPLEGWVRVIAVRALLDLREREKLEVPLEQDALLALVLPGGDPELEHVKQHYAAEFRSAFKEALQALDPRSRTLLRYSALDGLSIDEIGRLYRVHRASAARWLAKARTGLLEGTRARLMSRLDVTPEELDSILRLIESQLDASLGSAP